MPTQQWSVNSGNYGTHKINFIYAVFRDKYKPYESMPFIPVERFNKEQFDLACKLYRTIDPYFIYTQNSLGLALLFLESKFIFDKNISVEYILDIYESLKVPTYDFMDGVIIDSGHGGKDPGACWDNTHTEHMVVSKIAGLLEEEIFLDASTNFIPLNSLKIMYPNGVPSDVKPSLSKRVITPYQYAKDLGLTTEFFVSLHCNSAESKTARGLSIHYRVDYPNKMQNKDYAQIMYDEIIKQVPELKGNRTKPLVDEGTRLAVLNTAFTYNIPAVLVENGFISNEEDKNLLFNTEIRKKITKGIYEALKQILLKINS